MGADAPVIQAKGLVKRFGTLTAVDGVDLEVRQGEALGILGPNGAGKTTLLELIEGLQQPDTGTAFVMGFDSHRQASAAKARMGVQLQASTYFEFLTLRELLELFGSFYEHAVPAAELLAMVNLSDKANARVKQLSGGQQQRFTLAAALVNEPKVVFLDEPTTGLDPQARRDLWDLIRNIHAQGRTLVLTTHYMEEAEALCDRVAIMDRGRIVALDTPRALVRSMPDAYTVLLETSGPLDLGALPGLRRDGTDGHAYVFRTSDALGAVDTVRAAAVSHGVRLEHVEIRPATLEDVFLSLTGRSLQDGEVVA